VEPPSSSIEGVRRKFHLKKKEAHMRANKEKEALISQEFVRQRFEYIADTGQLKRRKNATHAKVGWIDGSGHLVTELFDKTFYVHRLIFLYHHGYMPDQIDHINRVKTDNRIENLRECTHSQNILNRGKMDHDVSYSSTYRGVSWEKGKTEQSKHWRTYLCLNDKIIAIGAFETEVFASKMRDLEVVRRGLQNTIPLNHPHLLKAYEAICSEVTEALPLNP